MIIKFFLIGIIGILSFENAFTQAKVKPDLYLYFQTDAQNGVFKTSIKSEAVLRNNKIKSPANDIDVYHYKFVSADQKKEYSYSLFSNLDKNNFCVSDTTLFKKHKVLPYKSLENIKGLISDNWDKEKVTFNRVFIIEKIAENQFKTVRVQLYFPFNSEGVKVKQIN